MSGGHFNYEQYRIDDIQIAIEKLIKYNDNLDELTIAEFKTAIKLLSKASVYVQRIDWLISDDDSEETFHERLAEELKELNNK